MEHIHNPNQLLTIYQADPRRGLSHIEDANADPDKVYPFWIRATLCLRHADQASPRCTRCNQPIPVVEGDSFTPAPYGFFDAIVEWRGSDRINVVGGYCCGYGENTRYQLGSPHYMGAEYKARAISMAKQLSLF